MLLEQCFTVVIEKGESSYGGYPLDIEGICAFGDSEDEVLTLLREAVAHRVAELRAEGKAVPTPAHEAATIHVVA